jgi:hypothetical protein
MVQIAATRSDVTHRSFMNHEISGVRAAAKAPINIHCQNEAGSDRNPSVRMAEARVDQYHFERAVLHQRQITAAINATRSQIDSSSGARKSTAPTP